VSPGVTMPSLSSCIAAYSSALHDVDTFHDAVADHLHAAEDYAAGGDVEGAAEHIDRARVLHEKLRVALENKRLLGRALMAAGIQADAENRRIRVELQ